MADVAVALEQKLRKMASTAAAAKHVSELLQRQEGATEAAKAAELTKLLMQADAGGSSVETLLNILELVGGTRSEITAGKRGLCATKVAMGIIDAVRKAETPVGPCSYCGEETAHLCANDSCHRSDAYVHDYCVAQATMKVRDTMLICSITRTTYEPFPSSCCL